MLLFFCYFGAKVIKIRICWGIFEKFFYLCREIVTIEAIEDIVSIVAIEAIVAIDTIEIIETKKIKRKL